MKTTPRLTHTCTATLECRTASVLVIDDDEHFRDLVRNLLEPAGITLLEAADACQGLALLRTVGPIDVVIVDMVMPDVDGVQALRRIKTIARGARVVAVSGAHAASLYLDLCSKLGADAVLPKSEIEQLPLVVERLLEPCG